MPDTTTTAPTTAALESAEDRAQRLHHRIKAMYSEEIFRLAYQYAEAEGAAREAARDRDWVRFVHRLAEHFPGIAPAIICVAETMSELDMGHATREKFGTAADPHRMFALE